MVEAGLTAVLGVLHADGLLDDRYDCDTAGRVVANYDRNQQKLVEYTYGPHGECETRAQHTGEVHYYNYNAQGMMTGAS